MSRQLGTESRRRVRTGCITCRSRHRKCDEGKPRCENCRSRNLDCRYRSNITFVQPWSGPEDRQCVENGSECVGIPHHSHQGSIDYYAETPISGIAGEYSSFPKDGSDNQNQQPVAVTPTASSVSLSPISRRRNLFAQQPALALPLLPPNDVAPNGQDALEFRLLSSYRYHVAPLLDLGLCPTYWGCDVPQRSKTSPGLRCAMHSLTSRIALADSESSDAFAIRAKQSRASLDELDQLSIRVLLGFKLILESPPTNWLKILQELDVDGLCSKSSHILGQLWRRIRLASTLMAPHSTIALHDFHFFWSAWGSIEKDNPLNTQLQEILDILGRTPLLYLSSVREQGTTIPLGAVWQSCWSDAQIWYAVRIREVQPVLELSTFETQGSSRPGDSPFPTILFSNTCAILANVALHLTALILLQHKPRLVSAAAEPSSFISPIWHIVRLIGIAQVAVEDGFWDPLIAVGVLEAAKRLTDESQIEAATDILQNIVSASGLQLENEIQILLDARTASTLRI